MSHQPPDYESAVKAIRIKTDLQPDIGLVLGSGLGGLADMLTDRVVFPYTEIPGFQQSTVEGHAGQLVIGSLEGKVVVAQQGRLHFYEGYGAKDITFPVRLMKLLGAETLILSNAAGGVNKRFQVGDLMLINDHINFVGMTGGNPLMGPNEADFGPRFVGMSQAYDRELRQVATAVAKDEKIDLKHGVYVCLSGPNFETPAEIRMIRTLGGDAVGMSTAHEVVVARHAGMRVLAFSGITNVAIDSIDTEDEANHEEVLEAGLVIAPKLMTIVKGVLRRL